LEEKSKAKGIGAGAQNRGGWTLFVTVRSSILES